MPAAERLENRDYDAAMPFRHSRVRAAAFLHSSYKNAKHAGNIYPVKRGTRY
ncbi:hypothetical protein BLAT2472_30494 [Burkholderia latens]